MEYAAGWMGFYFDADAYRLIKGHLVGFLTATLFLLPEAFNK